MAFRLKKFDMLKVDLLKLPGVTDVFSFTTGMGRAHGLSFTLQGGFRFELRRDTGAQTRVTLLQWKNDTSISIWTGDYTKLTASKLLRVSKESLKGNIVARQKKCSICGEYFEGYGNNAKPVNDGICCDICNDTVVLSVRLKNYS